jgi:osmotically-inducible protein OsmY
MKVARGEAGAAAKIKSDAMIDMPKSSQMRTPLVLLAIVAASTLSSGCVAAAVAGAGAVGMMAVQDRTFGEGIDDTAASSTVKTRLLAADANGFQQVDVVVEEGNLLLAGAVPDEQHKQTAEMIAHSVRTVHTVYNELNVGPARRLGRNANDEWISTQIRTRMVASPHVHFQNVNILTFNGNVYLMGLARSDDELHRAAEIASTVPGVQRVVSFMQVRERNPSYVAQSNAPAPVYTDQATSEAAPQEAQPTSPTPSQTSSSTSSSAPASTPPAAPQTSQHLNHW